MSFTLFFESERDKNLRVTSYSINNFVVVLLVRPSQFIYLIMLVLSIFDYQQYFYDFILTSIKHVDFVLTFMYYSLIVTSFRCTWTSLGL